MKNKIKLSKRLQAVADYVPENARLLDVGSDHAYLPVALIQEEKIDFAVAGEVVEGPFKIAQSHVISQELEGQITVRLASGIAAMLPTDAIDTIVIAGMGGLLISDILEAGKADLANVNRLILQPNNHESAIRDWLSKANFKITAESILREADKNYEIIVAEQGKMDLSVEEAQFGPFLMQEKNEIFKLKWQTELNTIDKILERLATSNEEKKTELEHRKSVIKGVLVNEN